MVQMTHLELGVEYTEKVQQVMLAQLFSRASALAFPHPVCPLAIALGLKVGNGCLWATLSPGSHFACVAT